MSQIQKPAENMDTNNSLPKDGDVILINPLKVTGKTQSDYRILVFTNTLEDVAKVSNDGTYSIEEKLDQGLNQLAIVSLDKNLKEVSKQNLSVYLQKPEDKAKYDHVTAGNVTKLFENLITATTLSGEFNIKTTDSTKTSIPTPPPTKSPQPKTKGPDIRVGDFIIALGNKSKDNEISASQINIIREDKPQIKKTYAAVKLASISKSKIFSASQIKDNKLLEFKLGTNSQIFSGDKKADEKAITKDKTAIIFYTPDGTDNIVSLAYLLP